MKRLHLTVTGIVQGVGFRPWLHRRSEELHLGGWARNTGFGVELELEGEHPEALRRQLEQGVGLPPLAVVEDVAAEEVPCRGETGFAILPSQTGARDTLIAPDIATCPDCRRELFAPEDRRYRFPFINCTNCGPRFTIVKGVPYDRGSTTMGKFPMCGDCLGEYADIRNRRYHAQPDCCAACGPKLAFLDEAGNGVEGDCIALSQALLQKGGILAVKGLGGFHLACTLEEETVNRLRRRKCRPARPLAIMCRDVETARRYCCVSVQEQAALEGARSPIVLLEKREKTALSHLSATHTLGVMLPYTPVHHLLFAGVDYDALVMTSANVSALPAIIGNGEAMEALKGIADGWLLHDRDIARRCDDSLLSVIDGQPFFYRRSRGYAPQPLSLSFEAEGILALGSEQKAGFAFGKGKKAFYSQHIGDLKNGETLEHYTGQIRAFEALFDLHPTRLVGDLHPDYLSVRYGQQRNETLLQVQHHHAHMCACMADNSLTGSCIGLTWDGTGLGSDGTVWGGETLIGGYTSFRRAASIRPVRLPGGDAAVVKIGRIAQSLCRDSGLPYDGEAVVEQMLQKEINCPPSSGMGRLFDGVYALLTGVKAVSYDGEGAVLLESLAHTSRETGHYTVTCYEEDILWLDTRGLIRELMADGASIEDKARKFHNTLVEFALVACRHARALSGLNRVVLSGGVFFNTILLRGITHRLEQEGFSVFRHHRVSTGDEGIALGQLAIAAHTGGN